MSVLADNRLFNVFQHTAARRRLDPSHTNRCRQNYVSTHSRPKAAGHAQTAKPADNRGFNTRPPEGGWKTNTRSSRQRKCFNTQPPEGGWLCENIAYNKTYRVSTHSRPKAAGISAWIKWTDDFCFNTQPPEGGWLSSSCLSYPESGFNTQPPEGGWNAARRRFRSLSCFNTQPPEGGWLFIWKSS